MIFLSMRILCKSGYVVRHYSDRFINSSGTSQVIILLTYITWVISKHVGFGHDVGS